MVRRSGGQESGEPDVASRELAVDGLRIRYRMAEGPPGAGPPVVMVHGLGVSSRYMVPAIRALGRDLPVYVPDQPGFGRSENPPEALDVAGLGDFVARFIAALGLAPAIVVANSYGCQIGADCAVRHPEAVARLVLQGPPSAPGDRGTLRLLRLWLANGRQEPSNLRILLKDYRACGPRRFWRTFRACRDYPLEAALARVRAPTLVIRGGRDLIVSEGWARRVAEMLPDGRLEQVPDAAHTMSQFWPEELAAAVWRFVRAEAPSCRARG